MTTSISPAVLQPGIVLGTSAVAIVTAAVNQQNIIKRAVFSNPTGGAVPFTVYRIPSGGSVGTATVIIPSRAIAAGATDLAPELANMVLNAGDTIQALAGTAASINAFVSGFTAT